MTDERMLELARNAGGAIHRGRANFDLEDLRGFTDIVRREALLEVANNLHYNWYKTQPEIERMIRALAAQEGDK